MQYKGTMLLLQKLFKTYLKSLKMTIDGEEMGFCLSLNSLTLSWVEISSFGFQWNRADINKPAQEGHICPRSPFFCWTFHQLSEEIEKWQIIWALLLLNSAGCCATQWRTLFALLQVASQEDRWWFCTPQLWITWRLLQVTLLLCTGSDNKGNWVSFWAVFNDFTHRYWEYFDDSS